MPVAIPNTTATANYVSYGGGLYDSGWLFVANGSVDVIYIAGSTPGLQEEGGPYTLPPGLTPLIGGSKQAIIGLKVRAAGGVLSATPQQYSGALFEPGLAAIGAGSPFTGIVSASGAITPEASIVNGITGSVTSAGAVSSGVGFSVVRNAIGDYQVTFTSPFSLLPLFLCNCLNVSAAITIPSTLTANGVRVQTLNPSTLANVDQAFNFLALVMQ